MYNPFPTALDAHPHAGALGIKAMEVNTKTVAT